MLPFANIQRIKLVQFGLQQLFIRQLGLVLGNQGRRQRAAEGVFDHFFILAGTQQHADGGVFIVVVNKIWTLV